MMTFKVKPLTSIRCPIWHSTQPLRTRPSDRHCRSDPQPYPHYPTSPPHTTTTTIPHKILHYSDHYVRDDDVDSTNHRDDLKSWNQALLPGDVLILSSDGLAAADALKIAEGHEMHTFIVCCWIRGHAREPAGPQCFQILPGAICTYAHLHPTAPRSL